MGLLHNTRISELSVGYIFGSELNHLNFFFRNHFANINLHESTFGLKLLSHNFFATSHGKSPCDGIGAVVKRSMTIAAIQRPPDQQIRNAQEMYAAALEEISGVRY